MALSPEEKARRVEGRLRQKRARKEKQHRDRLLVPTEVSARLGLRVAELARAMRTAGVTTPLTPAQVASWQRDPDSVPDWLAALRGDQLARAAEKEYQNHLEEEKWRLRALVREQSAVEKLREGRRFFNREERAVVQGIAYQASINLVWGMSSDDLNDLELRALEIYHIDPDNHATWDLHLDGCDGLGVRHCDERVEEMRLARRVDALIESVHKETAAREWSVGQPVSAWYGSRVGRIIKINKVTVKVRMVGNQMRDGNALIEKNLDPRYITTVPETVPATPEVGDTVTLRDHRGHIRVALVTAVDTPLFEAEYTLRSKEVRKVWFDPLALLTDGH